MTSTDPAPHPVPATGLAPDAVGAALRDRLESKVVDVAVAYDQVTVTVEADALPDAARICKDDPALAFDFWEFNSGVDLGDEGFALVVGLYSTVHRHRVLLRCVVPGGRERPTAPTLTGVYRGANWSEREAYDMFGIEFEGHPAIGPRILTVENFEGWPLRKEFLLSTREAKPWPGAKEPKEHPTEGEAAATTPAEEPVSAEDKAAAAKAKAERAKAKAAEMRAKKAAERAAAEAGGAQPQVPEPDAEGPRAAAPAAAGEDTPAGTPDPTTPEGAAEISGSPVAKDAAAGAVQGDTAAGAPGDRAGQEQPHEDLQREAEAGEGAAPSASGAPGIEVEGRHEGAVEQSGDKPAAETPGMTADPPGPADRRPDQTPAPAPDEDPRDDGQEES
jgi:NADH:ubiquinone oxidoreductase subunit C